MTRPIVYFFMRWSMYGESGWFASSGDAEGGIYSCDVNVAQVQHLLLLFSSGTKMFSCLKVLLMMISVDHLLFFVA